MNEQKPKKAKKIDFDHKDACLLAGFLMIGFGLWRIYPPAAFVICGSMLLWVGLPPRERRRE